MAINEGASMAIGEIRVKFAWTHKWYRKPVACIAYAAYRLRLIDAEKLADIIVACSECRIIK
jgi:hypothetical protein